MTSFDPDDESSPTYYLTWWWSQRNLKGRLPPSKWDWLPRDPLFHEYAYRKLGHEPGPVHMPTANADFNIRLAAAADMWRYLFMRHHEGERLFTVMKEDK